VLRLFGFDMNFALFISLAGVGSFVERAEKMVQTFPAEVMMKKVIVKTYGDAHTCKYRKIFSTSGKVEIVVFYKA